MNVQQDIKKIIKVDTIDEANNYLSQGWALLDTGTIVVDNEPKHYFIIGKTGQVALQEYIEKLKLEDN